MKKMKLFLFGAGLIATAIGFNACDDGKYSLDKVWYSIATVRPLNDQKTYSLTLDDGTTLWPAATAVPWYNPRENQRALIVYTLLSDQFQGYDHAVKVHDVRNVLTKTIAEDLGDKNDAHYGNDPVKILDMWIGDGYLNVQFGFGYGGSIKHFINLIPRDSVNTPYFLEFRHHAYNDPQQVRQTGLVAFDLSTLPPSEQEEIQLTIRVKTFEGDQDYTLAYHPGKPVSSGEEKKLSGPFAEIN